MARPTKKCNFKDAITKRLNGNDVKKIPPAVLKKEDKKVKPIKKELPKKSIEPSNESFLDLRVLLRSNPNSANHFECYHDIPSFRRVTKQTDIGSRIIVAKYPLFYKLYFMEYIDIGKKHFPFGGIKVYNATFNQTQYFYYDSVALHPTKKDKYRVKNVE